MMCVRYFLILLLLFLYPANAYEFTQLPNETRVFHLDFAQATKRDGNIDFRIINDTLSVKIIDVGKDFISYDARGSFAQLTGVFAYRGFVAHNENGTVFVPLMNNVSCPGISQDFEGDFFVFPIDALRANCLWFTIREERLNNRRLFGSKIPSSAIPIFGISTTFEVSTTVGLDFLYNLTYPLRGNRTDLQAMAEFQVDVSYSSYLYYTDGKVLGWVSIFKMYADKYAEISSLQVSSTVNPLDALKNRTIAYLFDESTGWLLESHFKLEYFSANERMYREFHFNQKGHDAEIMAITQSVTTPSLINPAVISTLVGGLLFTILAIVWKRRKRKKVTPSNDLYPE